MWHEVLQICTYMCIYISVYIGEIDMYTKCCFSSLEGSEVGSHPYEPPLLTKLDSHLPTKKTLSVCKLGLAPEPHGIILESLKLRFTSWVCPSLVLLQLDGASQSRNLMVKLPERVGSSAADAVLPQDQLRQETSHSPHGSTSRRIQPRYLSCLCSWPILASPFQGD